MKNLVAVTQMTSGANKLENLKFCESLIEQAALMKAKLVCLPENFMYMGTHDGDSVAQAEFLDGDVIRFFRELAAKLNIWLSLGGFQEKIINSKKIYNSHILISNLGEIACVYRKINLFSVTLPDKLVYREADYVMPGDKIINYQTPDFNLGFTICYDLRFSYLFASLRKAGAQVILVPAAFTGTTGQAHWEVLLRARAIETQCYILAPAQFGKHSPTRKTYGHAMIINPWGQVLASCGDNNNLAISEIDLDYLSIIRQNMPMS